MTAGAPDGNICGYEYDDGKVCQRQAGWGTEHLGDGRCKDHTEEVLKHRAMMKSHFLELYRSDTYSIPQAAAEMNRTAPTIWQWRRSDEEFDNKVREVKEEQRKKRVDAVEDTVFNMIQDGNASGSLIKFWLANRATEDWSEHSKNINVSQNQSMKQAQENLQDNDLVDALNELSDEKQEQEQSESKEEAEVVVDATD